jgi:hypothetical protein
VRFSFFDEIDRFATEDYVPTETDVLRARVRSTGIEEADFEFENLLFRYVVHSITTTTTTTTMHSVLLPGISRVSVITRDCGAQNA